MKENFSVQDECLLEGAVAILQRYAQHLQKNVSKVVTNYEATDFNEVSFLSDVCYTLENIEIVMTAAETIDSCIRKIRAEVCPNFENNTISGEV